MNTKITVYQPDNSISKGYLSLFKEIFFELNYNRWLMYQLFKKDFLSLYRQTFLGIFWVLVLPLVSVLTFVLLNKSKVFDTGSINMPYPLYALLGITFWQIVSTGLLASANSLTKAEAMITKINFSKKSLVIASCGQAIIAFIIQLFIVAILIIYYNIKPSSASLLLPLLMIPLLLITIGTGLILSLLNSIMRDIGNAIPVLLTFLMFLTPILYAKPVEGILSSISRYNPLYYLINTPRTLIITGKIDDWTGFGMSCAFSCLCFLVFLIIFHLSETRITERI